MRNKMITLCLTSYETATKMPNFSAWVRKQLLDLNNNVTDDPIFHQYQCPLCKIKQEKETRYARECSFCKYPMKYLGVVE